MLALSIGMGLLLAFTRRNPYLTRSPYVVKWSGERRHRMNFVLAAGGTGGHMIPAHALAAELKKRGHGVLLITDERGARIPGLFEGVPAHILPAGRLGGGPIGWLARVRLGAAKGRREAKRLYAEHRPERGGRLRRLSRRAGAAGGDAPRAFRPSCTSRMRCSAGSTVCSRATRLRSPRPIRGSSA